MRASIVRLSLLGLVLGSVVACGSGGDTDSGDDTSLPADAGADVPSLRDAVTPLVDITGDTKPPGLDVATDVGADVADRPFGTACRSNDDCASGWCVGWDEGYMCTTTCFSSSGCPEGWDCRSVFGTQPDVVFLCHPADSHICQPCSTDYECGSGFCLELGADQHCTRSCGALRPCPDGYECQQVASEETGVTAEQCIPLSESCDCGPLNVGRSRSCAHQNEFGTCWGSEACTAGGWSACSAPDPAEEACNGLDDDCDLLVDEELTPPAAACRNEVEGVGACEGLWACRASDGWVCAAAMPAAETCNYQDDDCDGLVDEDFVDENGAYAHINHCGVCGRSCEGALPHATERCEPPPAGSDEDARCVVDECDPGYVRAGDFACVMPTGGPCVPCEIDDHCLAAGGRCVEMTDGPHCARVCPPDDLAEDPCGDGYTCTDVDRDGETVPICLPDTGTCTCTPDSHGDERSCVVANEVGRCFGVEVCDGSAGWSPCDAATPAEEACNGADDDCDGFADEGLQPPAEPCRTTWQDPDTDELAVCEGDWVCGAEAGVTEWRCFARQAGPEACDYQDNDCDGAIDEVFKTEDGKYGSDEHCGACGNSCAGAIPNATARCDGARPTPTCVVASCARGFYRVSETSCAPVTDSTCTPCATDASCPVTGDRCLDLDGARACARDCGPDNVFGTPEGECGPGDECVADAAGGGHHCRPATGSCTCRAEADGGRTRSCIRSNAIGTCTGLQTCDPATGWDACSAAAPAEEVCNGRDDDCDGAVDDDVVPPATPCALTNEYGTCDGAWRCAEAGGATDWTCDARLPTYERCDYLDNDCDGATDEDFRDDATGTYDGFENCGLCGYSCDGAILFAAETACEIGVGGARCTVVSCEDGYFRPEGLSTVCVPVGGMTDCSPCGEDAHCAGLPGACVQLDGGRFCARSCGGEEDCAPGFVCQGGGCVPESGSCTCLAADDGATRPCFRANGFGTCSGSQECGAASGWTACTARVPAAEVCNGQDDDCNGLADEGVVPPVEPCVSANELGECTGAWLCSAQGGVTDWRCNAQTPAAETCDYVDNDCEGGVDEDFRDGATGAYVNDAHCGACGVACADRIPNATATCRLHEGVPRCEVLACAAGYYQAGDLTCLPVVDSRCTPCANDANCPVPGDLCLDLDGASYCGRDCAAGNLHGTPAGQCPAGYTCAPVSGVPGAQQCIPQSGSCTCLAEHDGATRTCVRANAVGTCYGAETCDDASGWSGCSARTPAAETCNAVDDDCNGQADDVAGLGGACTVEATLPNGLHACDGLLVCRPGSAAPVCNAPAPVVERCNYLDDDCDGQTDETFPTLYQTCSAGRGACQRFGFEDCTANGSATVCNAAAAQAGTEVCNGLDDDCDGTSDEDWPTKNQACTVGRGVCVRNGVFTCDVANPGGPVVCNATQGTGTAEVCDLLDNDCDGDTDEGWRNGDKYDQDTACGNCFTDCTQIYAKEDAYGRCNAGGATPFCQMTCCRTGATDARCDGQFDYYDLNQVPDDGCEFQLDPDAIYVSETDAAANDLPGCGRGPVGTGTGNRPCASIEAGLGEAQGAGRHKLIVADGLYEETVTVRAGIHLLGGHRADTWERHLSSSVTVVRGDSTATHKKTIIALNVNVVTTVEGFVIYGQANYATGGNSYAVYVQDSPRLTLRNNTIWAGRGGPGGRGSDGSDGTDGANGAAGLPAVDIGLNGNGCTPAHHRAGGSGGQRTCGGTAIYGGSGGTAVCPDYDEQDNPLQNCPADGTRQTTQAVERGVNGWGASGCPTGFGCGGAAGYDEYSDQYVGPYGGGCGQADNCCNPAEANCSICNYIAEFPLAGADGTSGGSGGNGGAGAGGSGAGTVPSGEWRGAPGTGGAAGVHGQGGGGGGAAGGVETWYCLGFGSGNYGTDLGGSGGGGGSGGCGAAGGGGGTAGGGSFGVFVRFTSTPTTLPTITGNTIHTGTGGDGGDGGTGGVGGAGGTGATGGAEGTGTTNSCAPRGGSGGGGGRGGHGGGGGGGAGGVSYGVFATGQGTANLGAWKTGNPIQVDGSGGAGGFGGVSVGTSGANGAAGGGGVANF